MYVYIDIYTQYIKLYYVLTISQNIDLVRILTISQISNLTISTRISGRNNHNIWLFVYTKQYMSICLSKVLLLFGQSSDYLF